MMPSHVLTLIAAPLTDAVVAAARAQLPRAAAADWLAPDAACDIAFTMPSDNGPREIAAAVRTALDGAPVDLAVLPVHGRRKRLLVADMDSTIIAQECIDEMARLAGKADAVSAVTERAMRGEIDFEGALRDRVRMLAGLETAAIERLLEERITLTPGAVPLVRTMRRHGAKTVLVTGGFTLFASVIAARVGFDQVSANELVVADGRLTGEVRPPILGRNAKAEALLSACRALAITPEPATAVGDGANDLGMIAAARVGAAFHAKPILADAADVRIDHGDLTALLYLQGYRLNEFVGR